MVAPPVALTLTTRWPAVVAAASPLMLSLVVVRSEYFGYRPMYMMSLAVEGAAVVLAVVVSILGDGRRALSPRWAAGLLLAMIGVGWAVSPLAMLGVTLAVTFLALPVLGVVLIGIDPRPLAVGSALWLMHSITVASALMSPGVQGSEVYAAQTSALVVGSLLGLLAAWGAGRRVLAVAR